MGVRNRVAVINNEDFGRASERLQGWRVLARYLEVGGGAHGLVRFRGLGWG